MESVVNVQTDEERMEKLFDKNDTYIIRYAEKIGENNYKAVVIHSEKIGKQEGNFDYENFLEKFDKPFERDENVFVPLSKDINFASKKLNEGMSPKNILKELKKHGSSYCNNEFYVKAVMKSDEVQQILKEVVAKNKSAKWTR